MLIQVNPHKIVLIKTNDVNSGEYNVNECTFEFSQEFDNLTCIAVFSLCDGTTRNITILNNRCIIPTEVLQQTGQVKIGVYGYSVQDDELVLRYSPTPQIFVVTEGSYKEGTEPVAPSPTDWEILVQQVSNNSRDISNIEEDITGINGEISGINIDIRDLQDTKANINDLASVAFSGSYTDLINKPNLSVYATKTDLSDEATLRENADINLQNQIDAISVSSDVVDVVGTYQELLDYDTQHLKDNDIVKVLDDSTHNNALSYYRWDKETETWSYIGSEGPFYTKGETQELLNAKEDKITTTNKLDADLVDDSNSTNKFVTEEDITYWDNKEDKSNKVTEINSSSTDTQYPSAKCVYDSQVAQDTEIDTLKMIYNILPTDTDTGETISIDNTGEMPIKSISLGGNTTQEVIPAETGTNVNATSISISDVNTDKEHTIGIDGNTYQETTTGKNLLTSGSQYNDTASGITGSYNDETGEFTISGTASTTGNTQITVSQVPLVLSSGTTLTFSSTETMPRQIYIHAHKISGGFQNLSISANNKYGTYTLEDDIDYYNLRFSVENETAYNFTTKFQLETGSTATDWEKFTYGPSPNPSYPQNIEIVTGENDIIIEGKNLFDKDNYNSYNGYFVGTGTATITSDSNNKIVYIKCKPNTQYTASKIVSKRFGIGYTTITPDASVSIYNTSSNNSGTSISITTGNDAKYLVVYIRNANVSGEESLDNIINSLQIEQGSTATTYEPYKSQTYPINLGNIELCKISTYQDRIYKRNDKWYLEKKTGKVTLDGSEINWLEFEYESGSYQFYIPISTILHSTTNINTIANYFKGGLIGDRGNIKNMVYTYSGGIAFNPNGITSIPNWTTFLSTHNTIVYYALSTPTTTEITDTTLVSQLNALANSTLYSTTNINTDTSNLLPYIDLQYNVVTPSPSPSRPSVVNVVKGNNTITISNSDNTQSQTYPINLPSGMELCKIGTYQDRIYSNNGKFYLEKNTTTLTITGNESNTYAKDKELTNTIRFSILNIMNTNNPEIYKCYRFKCMRWYDSIYADIDEPYISQALATVLTFNINKYLLSSLDVNGFKNWLNNNNTTIYIPLATSTTTEITDTTLINQLNNIKKAYSYDTQTNISQTNEDKPFIITAEMFLSLKNVLN